eukprot:gene13596-biopygen1341
MLLTAQFPLALPRVISLAPGGLKIAVARQEKEYPQNEFDLFSKDLPQSPYFDILRDEMLRTVEYRYAPSTWVQRKSIATGFLHFCGRHKCAVTPESAAFYVLPKKNIMSRSALQYLKTLLSMLTAEEPMRRSCGVFVG